MPQPGHHDPPISCSPRHTIPGVTDGLVYMSFGSHLPMRSLDSQLPQSPGTVLSSPDFGSMGESKHHYLIRTVSGRRKPPTVCSPIPRGTEWAAGPLGPTAPLALTQPGDVSTGYDLLPKLND